MSFLSFNPITSTPVQCGQGEQSIPFIFASPLLRIKTVIMPIPLHHSYPTLPFLLGPWLPNPTLAILLWILSDWWTLLPTVTQSRFLCQQVLSREIAAGVATLQYGKCSANLHVKFGRLPVSKRWTVMRPLWNQCEKGTSPEAVVSNKWWGIKSQWYDIKRWWHDTQSHVLHATEFPLLTGSTTTQPPALASSKRRQKTQICESEYFKFVRNNCFIGEEEK